MIERKLSHLALSDNGFLFDSATGHTYTLNSTGTFILRRLIENFSVEETIDSVIEEFEISKEVLVQDLDQFLSFLSELGLVEKG